VLLSKEGEVKLTDFGLAKAQSQIELTDPGVVKGKFGYLSPEAAAGETVDARTDIFAAGIVLWELLANRRLFYGATETETVDLVRVADVPPLSRFNPEVKPELQQIIGRALARDPKKRFTSAREFGESLADYLAKNSLRATSFDLARMLERLFASDDADSDAGADGVVRRQKLLSTMIEEEIANLSMAGHSSAARNLVGRDPIDPGQLALGALNAPIFDLSATWKGEGPPRAVLLGSDEDLALADAHIDPEREEVVVVARAATAERGDFLLGPIDLQLALRDRVAITGPNGAGKSTLLALLLGRLAPTNGQVSLGAGVVVGEVDQARALFEGDDALAGAFSREVPEWPMADVRTLLAKFGLGPHQAFRPADSLSPGERTRAALALLQARGVNLLVLDEPTNHLDLPAIEQLEEALESFEGTVLLVTHDRRMLDTVRLTRRWHVVSGQVVEVPAG
jgi:ABC-type lipoprotein export system ATPase subunit